MLSWFGNFLLGCAVNVASYVAKRLLGRPPRQTHAPEASETDTAPPDPFDLLKGYPDRQPRWVGRGDELGRLDVVWEHKPRTRIFAVIGYGGEGKSALVRRFVEELRRQPEIALRPVVVWWSFYFNRAADQFFTETLSHFGIPLSEEGHPLSAEQRARKLVDLLRNGVAGRPLLLVLDGLESLQEHVAGREGRLADSGLKALMREVFDDTQPRGPASGMVFVTSRESLMDLKRGDVQRFDELTLDHLSIPDGVSLLTKQYKLNIPDDDAERFVKEVGGHALTLTLTGSLLHECGATANTLQELREFIASEEAKVTDPDVTDRVKAGKRPHRLPGYVLRHCRDALKPLDRQFMRLLSCCVSPATREDIEKVFLEPIPVPEGEKPVNDKLTGLDYAAVRNGLILHLGRLRLLEGDEQSGYDTHPLIGRFFHEEEPGPAALTEAQRKAVHSRFFNVLIKRQEKHHPDTLKEMQPLLDAVQHGCRGGRADEASEVYCARIERKDTGRLTSFMMADLGAVDVSMELLRAFYPDGDFAHEPNVSNPARSALLVSSAAYSLMTAGRVRQALPLFERGKNTHLKQENWRNASVDCQNLSECYTRLGELPTATRAAAEALDLAKRIPDNDPRKHPYTQFSHGYAAVAQALLGDDEAATEHFGAALDLGTNDYLASLDGGWHSTWLAQRGEIGRARGDAAQNAAACKKVGDLPSQTFARATQALIERLAWVTGDPERRTLEEMTEHVEAAVEVGRRSGAHFFLTCALLEAGRCATARAEYEPQRREEFVGQAERYLDQAEERAEEGEYRLILADAHVTRAELARLAGDEEQMRAHCQEAIRICEEPKCGYAWARQDAEKLLAKSEPEKGS